MFQIYAALAAESSIFTITQATFKAKYNLEDGITELLTGFQVIKNNKYSNNI